MEPDQPATELATPDEVRQAIENLTAEEALRIRKAARLCLIGTEYADPAELVNEVVVRTMKAASGGKGRHWPKAVPFVAFVIQTMKGLADDSRNGLEQTRTDYMEAMAIAGQTGEDAIGKRGHCHPDFVTQVIAVEEVHESRSRAQLDCERIDQFFAGDDQVTWIIMGRKDALPAAEIRQLGQMNQTQYETALRRLRRGLEKLFPGRSSP